MAGRIQGITVEIGGDTTKLTTALKGVNIAVHIYGEWRKYQPHIVWQPLQCSPLVYPEFLCPATDLLCFFVVDIQDIHGSVPDICKEIGSVKISRMV